MTTLYRVPWQPQYLLRLETLNLLGRAVELAEHNIELDDAYREYQTQKDLYEGYINHVPGFNLASNPDDPNGQNNHRRATAVDIVHKADIPYMLEAGFTQDATEWWHFNLPGGSSFATINEYTIAGETTPAVVTATPLAEEDEMSKLFITTVADDRTKYVFGGQGVIPIPIPNGTWLGVLNSYVDAMNEPDPDKRASKLGAFTTAQWKLIRQALSADEPSADLTKAIDQKGM